MIHLPYNEDKMSATKVFILALFFFALTKSQQTNSGYNVNELLQECYNTSYLINKESRLPLSLPILLDLIRRVEDSKTSLDARVVAYTLLHRFRQDGIIKLPSKNSLSLPFSPNGYQADKYRILLTRFIPGDAQLFPEESLTPLQKCSLHFMLSNKFELTKRDDEDIVCNKLGRYRMRNKRGKDVENIPSKKSSDVETVNKVSAPRGYTTDEISDCPVEAGVIYTPWGSIQAGTMLAGISSGFSNQQVGKNEFSSSSIFAVTLAGDITETALQQGIRLDQYNVGLKGDWLSTFVPRWYLINRKNGETLTEMTDAEIRAGLDGLIMSNKVTDWKSKYSTLKVSQIIDSYYSPRGAFSSNYKACNRNAEATTFMSEEKLLQETLGFSAWYNDMGFIDGTVTKDNLPRIVEPAVKSFLNYYAKISTKQCETDFPLDKIITEVTIILDADWEYNIIQPILAHVLEVLDTNKYESNYTLISAGNGEVIINASSSLVDFHELYNETVHKKQASGFNLIEVMPVVEERLKIRLAMEQEIGKSSGKSQIVLFVPHLKTLNADTTSFISNRLDTMYKDFYPDTKLMVLGSGNRESYTSLVVNSNDDVFTIPDNYNKEDEVKDTLILFRNRVAEIPRRITNPKCGAYMSGAISTNTLELYAEPGTINYYKVSPNYFYGEGKHAVKVRVQADILKICFSRFDTRPRLNEGNSDCKDVATSGEEVFDLTDTCSSGLGSCSPLYISVEAPRTNNSNARCSDPGCRFPDNVKFTITTEDFVCRSSANTIWSSILLLITMFLLLQ